MPPSESKTDRIAARLREIEQSGTLTPEAVLADAVDPSSPLHGEFEWDDAKAAHEQRLDRARAVIRSVRVVIHDSQRQATSVCYVRDPRCEPSQQGYVATQVLKTDRDLAREALNAEVSRAGAAMARARDVAEALGLTDEVEDTIRSIETLRARSEEKRITVVELAT